MVDKFICQICGKKMNFYGETPLCEKCNFEAILDYYWIKGEKKYE